MKKNLKSLPSFSAEWIDGDSQSGVHTEADGLLWWSRPDGPGGHFGEVGSSQSYEDFLINGPMDRSVPAQKLDKLRSVLEAHGYRIDNHPTTERQSAQSLPKQKRGKRIKNRSRRD